MNLVFSNEQEDAIALGINRNNRISGVTGAAGTGKTTVIGEVYKDGDWRMPVLVAPTGRAAKRIQEATGIPAKTIHRFMRYSMPADDDEAGLPSYDKFNKFPNDCVLVDEASMVSEDLYRAVVDAMPGGGCIRFFGDANQLPPVEGHSPFVKLLAKYPAVTLTHNYRSNDGIIRAASQILNNRAPEPNDKFRMYNPGNGNLMQAIDDIVDDSFRGMSGQVIIPVKKGKYGTHSLNHYMQQKLNPTTGPVVEIRINEEETRRFRKGDKIIWTKNNYRLNLFNGQIGWILDFDGGDIICMFEDRDVRVPTSLEAYDPRSGRAIFQYDPRTYMELAYAVTTHKAQGSEFERVLIILQRSYINCRSNFYTAVTRAKEQATVLLGPGGLIQALRK